MEFYIHLCLNSEEVLFSNLPVKLLSESSECKVECVLEKCKILDKEKRHGKLKNEDGYIYLCSYDSSITNKIFKRYFDVLNPLFDSMCRFRADLKNNEESKSLRLQHNINSYNAKIQDELESIIPQESIDRKDWRETISTIKKDIQNDLEGTAFVLLRVLKNIKLINAEMNVYDLITSEQFDLELQVHSIHKVIGLTLQPFFLDFIENGNTINIGECHDNVLIDYASVSVILGHIWDNAAKYMWKNSALDLSFTSEHGFIVVNIAMLSLMVNKDEKESIFLEKQSGHWAKSIGLDGNGIGMFYAKKLTEMNYGTIDFIAGDESFRLEGIPYAHNKIVLKLKREL